VIYSIEKICYTKYLIFFLKRENEKSRKTEIALIVDGVKYTQTTEIELEEAPGIHLVFSYPAGKTELLAKFKKLGENEYSGIYFIHLFH
jgi:hypothetical protein